MKESSDPEIPRAQARVGRTLRDKWRLDRLLGVGGMAAVYEASHRNGKRAAIKMLHPVLTRENDLRERFLREGYAANAVGHPGAVSVLDDDADDDGTVFLVMELLEGESLDQRWERLGKKLSPEDVLATADAVLDTLAAAHEKGIVHRDLKPDNVFRTTAGDIKILDFGIARLRGTPSGTSSTRAGSLLGTPGYMAPEQARGRNDEVDARSDLWSLGATMFTLLAGRTVHEAKTMNELLLAAMTSAAVPLASVAPDVPPVVAAVVDKALAFERDQRFQDARSMQAAVRAAMAAIGSAAPPPIVRRVSTSHAPLPLTRARASRSSIADDAPPQKPRAARAIEARPRGRSPVLLVVAGVIALAVGAAVPFVLARVAPKPPAPGRSADPSNALDPGATPGSAPLAVTAPVSAAAAASVSAAAAASVSTAAAASVSTAAAASVSAAAPVSVSARPPAIASVPKRPFDPPGPRPFERSVVQEGRELEITIPAPKE